jgi:hypothetical protein
MFYISRKAKHDISISLLLFSVIFIRWNNKMEFNKPFHRQNEYCLSLSIQSQKCRQCVLLLVIYVWEYATLEMLILFEGKFLAPTQSRVL